MSELNVISEKYLDLILALSIHDNEVVDFYYGKKNPQEIPLVKIETEAEKLFLNIEKLKSSEFKEQQRSAKLRRSIGALVSRVKAVLGKEMSFRDEAKEYYSCPLMTEEWSYFEESLIELEKIVAGDGTLAERIEKFENIVISKEKVEETIKRIIEDSKNILSNYISAPEQDQLKIDLIEGTGKGPAYHKYKGEFLGEVKGDIAKKYTVNTLVHIILHEAYPGHHLHELLREQKIVNESKWEEYALTATFDPSAVLDEGLAEFAPSILFTPQERIKYEEKIAINLGMSAEIAADHAKFGDRLRALRNKLSTKIAVELDKENISEGDALQWLLKYGLYSQELAEKRLKTIKSFGAFAISYDIGRTLVEKRLSKAVSKEAKWGEYEKLFLYGFENSDLTH